MKTIQDEVLINSSLAKVWDVLVNPEKSPEYMYTCAIESDFSEGSPFIWRGIHDQIVYVSGKLIEFTPKKKMVYSVIDPSADYEQSEENHLIVTYELSEQDGKILFVVTQAGYETVANGKKRYQESVDGGGWSSVVAKIKEIAER